MSAHEWFRALVGKSAESVATQPRHDASTPWAPTGPAPGRWAAVAGGKGLDTKQMNEVAAVVAGRLLGNAPAFHGAGPALGVQHPAVRDIAREITGRDLTGEEEKLVRRASARLIASERMQLITQPNEVDAAYLAGLHAGVGAEVWYNSMHAIDKGFGSDAQLFKVILAATSPHATVPANLTMAVSVYAWIKANGGHVPPGGRIPFISEDATGFIAGYLKTKSLEALRGQEDSGGLKIYNFVRALEGDSEAVVLDVWMMRSFGIPDGKKLTKLQYHAISEIVRERARAAGIQPMAMQAIIWTGMKLRHPRQGDEIRSYADVLIDRVGRGYRLEGYGGVSNALITNGRDVLAERARAVIEKINANITEGDDILTARRTRNLSLLARYHEIGSKELAGKLSAEDQAARRTLQRGVKSLLQRKKARALTAAETKRLAAAKVRIKEITEKERAGRLPKAERQERAKLNIALGALGLPVKKADDPFTLAELFEELAALAWIVSDDVEDWAALLHEVRPGQPLPDVGETQMLARAMVIAAVAGGDPDAPAPLGKYDPNQPRDDEGLWTSPDDSKTVAAEFPDLPPDYGVDKGKVEVAITGRESHFKTPRGFTRHDTSDRVTRIPIPLSAVKLLRVGTFDRNASSMYKADAPLDELPPLSAAGRNRLDAWTASYRRQLQEMDPSALARVFRDKRGDRKLSESAVGVEDAAFLREQVDRMTGVYRRRASTYLQGVEAMEAWRAQDAAMLKQGWDAFIAATGANPALILKRWRSMRDDRVRPEHVEADAHYGLDGVAIPYNELFVVGEDTVWGPPHGYACRCTLSFEPQAGALPPEWEATPEAFDALAQTAAEELSLRLEAGWREVGDPERPFPEVVTTGIRGDKTPAWWEPIFTPGPDRQDALARTREWFKGILSRAKRAGWAATPPIPMPDLTQPVPDDLDRPAPPTPGKKKPKKPKRNPFRQAQPPDDLKKAILGVLADLHKKSGHAAWDETLHPRYDAGTPDGKGGEFAPSNSLGPVAGIPGPTAYVRDGLKNHSTGARYNFNYNRDRGDDHEADVARRKLVEQLGLGPNAKGIDITRAMDARAREIVAHSDVFVRITPTAAINILTALEAGQDEDFASPNRSEEEDDLAQWADSEGGYSYDDDPVSMPHAWRLGPRVYSQHVTQTTRGTFDPNLRERIEGQLLGVSDSTPAHRRPVYGYLSDSVDGDSTAYSYGPITLRLKRGVRERTTFMEGDTLSVHGRHVTTDYNDGERPFSGRDDTQDDAPWRKWERPRHSGDAIPSPVNRPSGASLGIQMYYESPLSDGPKRSDNYFEAQVFGGVRIEDVDEIIFENGVSDETFGRFQSSSKLKALGIPVRRTRTPSRLKRPVGIGKAAPGVVDANGALHAAGGDPAGGQFMSPDEALVDIWGETDEGQLDYDQTVYDQLITSVDDASMALTDVGVPSAAQPSVDEVRAMQQAFVTRDTGRTKTSRARLERAFRAVNAAQARVEDGALLDTLPPVALEWTSGPFTLDYDPWVADPWSGVVLHPVAMHIGTNPASPDGEQVITEFVNPETNAAVFVANVRSVVQQFYPSLAEAKSGTEMLLGRAKANAAVGVMRDRLSSVARTLHLAVREAGWMRLKTSSGAKVVGQPELSEGEAYDMPGENHWAIQNVGLANEHEHEQDSKAAWSEAHVDDILTKDNVLEAAARRRAVIDRFPGDDRISPSEAISLAVKDYQVSSSPINDSARGIRTRDFTLSANDAARGAVNFAVIDAAMPHFKTTRDMHLYRGVREELAGDLATLKPGDSFRDLGFASFSLDRQVANGFGGVVIEIDWPKGWPAIPALRSDEHEYILPAATEFDIVEVRPFRSDPPDGLYRARILARPRLAKATRSRLGMEKMDRPLPPPSPDDRWVWRPGDIEITRRRPLGKYDPNQPRDEQGQWTDGAPAISGSVAVDSPMVPSAGRQWVEAEYESDHDFKAETGFPPDKLFSAFKGTARRGELVPYVVAVKPPYIAEGSIENLVRRETLAAVSDGLQQVPAEHLAILKKRGTTIIVSDVELMEGTLGAYSYDNRALSIHPRSFMTAFRDSMTDMTVVEHTRTHVPSVLLHEVGHAIASAFHDHPVAVSEMKAARQAVAGRSYLDAFRPAVTSRHEALADCYAFLVGAPYIRRRPRKLFERDMPELIDAARVLFASAGLEPTGGWPADKKRKT